MALGLVAVTAASPAAARRLSNGAVHYDDFHFLWQQLRFLFVGLVAMFVVSLFPRELARRSTGRTLYILDEPTTGLHFHDVAKLMEVLHELVEQGNSVVVIEHNLDVIKTADWIIDLGPEGGVRGGEIIAEGTPEAVVKVERSFTGRYLKELLER